MFQLLLLLGIAFGAMLIMPKLEPLVLGVWAGIAVADRMGRGEIAIWAGIATAIIGVAFFYAIYRSKAGPVWDFVLSVLWGLGVFKLAQAMHVGTAISWTILGVVAFGVMLLIHGGHRASASESVVEES